MNRSSVIRAALSVGVLASAAAAQSLLATHGEVIYGAGEAAPGVPGALFYTASATAAFYPPVIDENGTIVFRSRLEGTVGGSTHDDYAFFIGRGRGDTQLLFQLGSQAPGQPVGTLVRGSGSSSGSTDMDEDIMISAENEIVYFGAKIYDPSNPANTPTSSDTAVFWGPPGALTTLAREGEQVPGLPVGVNYGSLSSFSRQYAKINRYGIVALQCALSGAVTSADGTVFMTGVPGAMEVVMREGDPVPGLPGITWGDVSSTAMSYSSAINDLGQILLDTSLDGTGSSTDDRCLAVYTPGVGVQILSREGDQAPGAAPGVIMTGSPSRADTAWNNSGATVWMWNLSGPGITTANEDAVFYGGLGGYAMILQEGDPTGMPGGETFGTIEYRTLACNESATICFRSELRDSTGGALPTDVDTAVFYGGPGSWTPILREGDVVSAVPPSSNGPWTFSSLGTYNTNLNARGQVLLPVSLTDGVDSVTHWLLYDPVRGMQVVRDQTETYTTTVGTGTAESSASYEGAWMGCADSPCWFNNQGDFAFRQSVTGVAESVLVKGHTGGFIATPSSFESATGGTQNWTIDLGPGAAPRIWVALASESGTRPGFPSPLGAGLIPLNIDAATQLSLDVAGQGGYANIGVTLDGTATGGLTLPPGYGVADMHHAVIMLDLTLMSQEISEPASLRRY